MLCRVMIEENKQEREAEGEEGGRKTDRERGGGRERGNLGLFGFFFFVLGLSPSVYVSQWLLG